MANWKRMTFLVWGLVLMLFSLTIGVVSEFILLHPLTLLGPFLAAIPGSILVAGVARSPQLLFAFTRTRVLVCLAIALGSMSLMWLTGVPDLALRHLTDVLIMFGMAAFVGMFWFSVGLFPPQLQTD